ncbi:MAG: cardiolipin synthase [Thermoanaerobaculia bacterium]
MLFRKNKPSKYPRRPTLPIVRRKAPLHYQLRHQFGVRDEAFPRSIEAMTGAPLLDGNCVDVLENGVRFFPSMLEAIRESKQTITLEFYIYWDGEVGRTFAEALAERARAGVSVKVILDAVGSATMSKALIDFLSQNGIEITWYHAIRWYNLSRINHRTHRKLMIVDGRIGFCGGFGIADLWQGDADSPDHWRETVVRVEGPAVTQMQYAFMDNWLKSRGEVLPGPAYFPRVEPCGPYLVQITKSSPSEGVSAAKLLYMLLIVSATRTIRITSAYFIPDRDMIRALEDAVRRGVDVKVIVPGRWTDVPIARQASRMHYDILLRRGLHLYEYQNTMIHAKTMVVDGIWSTIGSSNFDVRSFRLNDEVNVNVYDERIAARMEEGFERDLANSMEITLTKWGRRSVWARTKELMAGLLKPQL